MLTKRLVAKVLTWAAAVSNNKDLTAGLKSDDTHRNTQCSKYVKVFEPISNHNKMGPIL